MLHTMPLRLALSTILAAAFLPAAVFAQSQDTQSVAEAAAAPACRRKRRRNPPKSSPKMM